MTRREFVLSGSAAFSSSVMMPQAEPPTLSVSTVLERIRSQVQIPWRTQTVDRIVAGDDSTPVLGIATTMMATLDVLQRAVAAHKNLVITHEPTFYLHQDITDDIKDDATLRYKQAYIRDHKLVVFRFHDHWHARRPDGIATGMAQQLGWEKNMDPFQPKRFTFTGATLLQLAQHLQQRLDARTMRVLGDPDLPVKNVLADWGYASRLPGINDFARPDVDLLIAGETREWELVEYAQDSISAGNRKALILLGHVASEQSGMIYCAEWLKGFIHEVPIEFIPAREPFWSPANPLRA